MKSKARWLILLFAVCLLFYVHDNPVESKEKMQEVAVEVEAEAKELLTEENITHAVDLIIHYGTKFSEVTGRIVKNALHEMGYTEAELRGGGA